MDELPKAKKPVANSVCILFAFHLPDCRHHSTKQQARMLSDTTIKALRDSEIMIVDDSAAIRDLLQGMLRELGIENIRTSSNGMEALNAFADKPADIVLCDLYMPNMDGVELLRKLGKQSPGLAVLPISSLDSRLRFSVARMADELGLNVLGALGKPFTESQLHDALSAFNDEKMISAGADSLTEDQIQHAMDDQRVELWYQPQVRITDGVLASFEALVRMRDNDGGLVSPAAFIGMCEATGQIAQLTHVIIETGLSQLALWHRQGRNFGLSLNVSAANLVNLDLPEHIESLARSMGLSPEKITIELTESQVYSGAELYDVIARFRMRGFGLALDDYGTGDSSLSRLRSLPFTELKLDQSFVRGCVRSAEQATIVSSSIKLAHDLGMQVVAEGVQSQDEWDFLEKNDCDLAQGYLVGRPLDAANVPRWHSRWARLCRSDFSGPCRENTAWYLPKR